jgi:hypothetical protein
MHATAITTLENKGTAGPRWGLVLVLSALLAAQIALALVLGLRGSGPGPAGGDARLLSLDPAAVQRVRIAQRGSDPVVLEKTDKGWQIQSLHGFPAAHGRVDALIERLTKMKRGLPVATSQDALARLKVADQDHEGQLTIEGGGSSGSAPGSPDVSPSLRGKELANLYLGDSAGARRRYVRPAGDDAVYETELSAADIPAKADDWADRALLKLDERDLQHVEIGGVALDKADGTWRLADLKDGETLDQPKVEDLVSRLGSLSFVSVLGAEDRPEYGQAAPALTWQVGLASGDTLAYRLSRLEDEPTQVPPKEGEAPKPEGPHWYVLKVSNRPFYLKVAGYAAEPLLGTTRAALLVKPEAKSEAGAEGKPGAESPTPADQPPVGTDPEARGEAPPAASGAAEPPAAAGPQ